ncbi:uncharacterized protein LOC143585771 [Bidens hawaiensis]|uniref:uncharacterized protein LOC143585771 n=1 Tax=Bidens hawaiensis TaxID=980011 RepID=UPI004048F53C
MESQKFTMLNEIYVLKTSPSTLKVRVLRLWSIKDNKNVNEDFLIKMVLMDEDVRESNPSHPLHIGYLSIQRFLKGSSTLTIVNPSVGLNGSNYCVIDCSNKLVLGPNTHVNPCQEFDGRMCGFKMISFESLINKDISLKSTVDIIGHVVHVFKSNASNVKDKNKRTMEICDLSLLGLLNGNDVSVHKPIPVKMLPSFDDEFLRATDFFNICDICNIIFLKSIIILGTIKAIYPDTEWYYIGCNNCSLKLMENNGEGGKEYECKTVTCNVLAVIPTPRFKIKMRVQDFIGFVSLTLFDGDAKILTNKTAKELIDSQNEHKVENGGFPAELDCLLEKIFAFKVDMWQISTSETMSRTMKRQNGRLLSDIGDNQTPSSNVDAPDVATDTKGMSTSSDDKLKRKLVEVFEVDDDASMSATKLKSTIEEMGTTSESK